MEQAHICAEMYMLMRCVFLPFRYGKAAELYTQASEEPGSLRAPCVPLRYISSFSAARAAS